MTTCCPGNRDMTRGRHDGQCDLTLKSYTTVNKEWYESVFKCRNSVSKGPNTSRCPLVLAVFANPPSNSCNCVSYIYSQSNSVSATDCHSLSYTKLQELQGSQNSSNNTREPCNSWDCCNCINGTPYIKLEELQNELQDEWATRCITSLRLKIANIWILGSTSLILFFNGLYFCEAAPTCVNVQGTSCHVREVRDRNRDSFTSEDPYLTKAWYEKKCHLLQSKPIVKDTSYT